MNRRIINVAAATGLACLLWAGPATADPVYYTWDVSSGNWDVTTNWSPNGSPWLNAEDVADVNSGTITATAAYAFLGRLNVHGGATLQVTQGGGSPTAANLHMAGGEIEFTATNNRTLSGALFLDADTEIRATASGSDHTIDSTITGSGKLTKTGEGGVVLRAAAISLTGGLDVNAGSLTIWDATDTDNDILDEVEGPVSIAAGATLKLRLASKNATATVLDNVFSGSGKIDLRSTYSSPNGSHVLFKGTTLNPGGVGTAGTMTVDTLNVTFGEAGGSKATLNVELGGTAADQFDVLYLDKSYDSTVNTTLTLANVDLVVSFLGGFKPLASDSFKIVDNAPSSGTRAAATGAFNVVLPDGWSADVNYAGGDGNDVVLSNFAFVPEPATLAFLAAGGLGMAGAAARRRRRRA